MKKCHKGKHSSALAHIVCMIFEHRLNFSSLIVNEFVESKILNSTLISDWTWIIFGLVQHSLSTEFKAYKINHALNILNHFEKKIEKIYEKCKKSKNFIFL